MAKRDNQGAWTELVAETVLHPISRFRSAWRLRRRPQSIFDYAYEDFEVVGYEHHPAIRAPVAV